MAYWWVSQNRTYAHERDGGFLWAPTADKAGNVPHHWATMREVKPGDLIFSYVGAEIKALAIAVGDPHPSDRPPSFEDSISWEKKGIRIDVRYEDLKTPIPISALRDGLVPLLSERYSPLTRGGSGNQGYLFALSPEAGRLLLDRIDADLPGEVENLVRSAAPLSVTERINLVRSRVGQGRFRDDLLRMWKSRCSVTGLDLPDLLTASHIKPWSDSNNAERLDRFNGFLLAPSYNAAFDHGFITFDDVGLVALAPSLSQTHAKSLGIDPKGRILALDQRHRSFLAYHRKHVFRRDSST